MTPAAGKKERRENLKEFYDMLAMPLALAVVGTIFFKMTMLALGGGEPGLGLVKIYGGARGMGAAFGLPFGLMCLMAYLWGRPAYRYAEAPDDKLKEAIRRRLANIYRDAFLMIVITQAVALAVAALAAGGISWKEFTAAGAAFLAQAALLVVYVDNRLSRQKKLLAGLYSPEELIRPKTGFSVPISGKLAMAIAGFAILPFLIIYLAAHNQAIQEPVLWDFRMLLGISAAMLLSSLLSIYNGIQVPLEGLIAKMGRVAAGDYSKSSIYFSDEVARLKAGFNKMVDGLREREEKLGVALENASRLESELAVARATSELAAQVAHDIRSPLAALAGAAGSLGMPAEQRQLVEETVARMQGIADGLLGRYRAPGRAAAEVRGLAGLIRGVMAEKRLEHGHKEALRLEFTAEGEPRAAVEPGEFLRIISNLVNNSVEALDGGGRVAVRLSSAGGLAFVEIQDDGRGIPEEILGKLGVRGATFGKEGGLGLGLFHARTSAESWGGGLKIRSGPGRGTAVTIELPLAGREAPGGPVVLLDNDLLVHMTWKAAARAAGAELKAYRSPHEFRSAVEGFPKDTSVYIDSDLGEEIKGEEIAAELHQKGFTDISMATGHGPERFSGLPWLKVTGKEPPWGW